VSNHVVHRSLWYAVSGKKQVFIDGSDGQTVAMLPVVLYEALFMAESPDRRLIEPGANMVNERLSGNFERRAWAAASHVLPARARANVTVLDILLDYRLCFSYDAKISLIEGRIPDAI
jgi:hypothetical protein